MDQEALCCPFCGYTVGSEYQIMLHMETQHAEGQSPFVVKDDASFAAVLALDDSDDVQYANCPVKDCGEAVLLTELNGHIDMHDAEQRDMEDAGTAYGERKLESGVELGFDTQLAPALRNVGDYEISPSSRHSFDAQAHAKAAWKSLLKMPDTSSRAISSSKSKNPFKRLGRSELGPHAHEKQMPAWLVKVLGLDGEVKIVNRLDADGKLKRVKVCPNQQSGVVPVVAQLLEQDPFTEYAYLCHPAVKHVSKLNREGGFCGYRNIQMMVSYIIGVMSQGHENFNGKLPTIFEIQDYIENAWDLGIYQQARFETGGIRGTRKYIGTPEAQAMFCSLGIAHDAQALKMKKDGVPAHQLLFQVVENYFVDGCTDFNTKVRRTTLPPLYFQHPGHSMTIIGIEKKKDGETNLIVFDPMFHDASNVTKLIDQTFTHKAPAEVLKAYRRGLTYLRKYKGFELLRLTVPSTQGSGVNGVMVS